MTDENESAIHVLKTIEPFWSAVTSGRKTFEVRKMDRPYAVGDFLILGQFPRKFQIPCGFRVTYILTHDDFPVGVAPGYCVMGMRQLEPLEFQLSRPRLIEAVQQINQWEATNVRGL